MITLQLNLHTLAPLALSIRRATGNDLDTLSYVPGSALRGALAYAWLEAHGNPKHPPERFRDLFLSGDVRFGDLYIGGAEPAPLSARVCSRSPQDHAFADHLLQTATRAHVNEECPDCGAKRRRVHGFLRNDRREGYREVFTETRRVAHTAIDPRLLRAANQQFHSSRLINENQSFQGTIRCADALAGEVMELVSNSPKLYLGRGRTRGQGRVAITATEQHAPRTVTVQQVQEFNREAVRLFPELEGRLLFTCGFVSAGILLDEWLLSKRVPDCSDIDGVLSQFEIIASFCGFGAITGWNSAAGLPKSEWQSIKAGSVYLFSRSCIPTQADFDELTASLNRALENSVGERVAEGFGDAVFCHPFHIEKAEV